MWMISHDKLISCTTGKASVRQGQWSVRVLSGPCPAYRFENLRGFHERSCQRTSRSLHKDLMVATDLKNIAACHVLNVSKVLPTAQSFCDLDVCNWQGFKHWHSALGSAVAWFLFYPNYFLLTIPDGILYTISIHAIKQSSCQSNQCLGAPLHALQWTFSAIRPHDLLVAFATGKQSGCANIKISNLFDIKRIWCTMCGKLLREV